MSGEKITPAALTAAAILHHDAPAPVRVEVPEWGGAVYVRVMSGRERDAFEFACMEDGGAKNQDNFRARLAVRCVCDEAGALLFTPADADALGAGNGAALSRILEVAAPLNGLTRADQDDLTKKS